MSKAIMSKAVQTPVTVTQSRPQDNVGDAVFLNDVNSKLLTVWLKPDIGESMAKMLNSHESLVVVIKQTIKMLSDMAALPLCDGSRIDLYSICGQLRRVLRETGEEI